MTTSDWEGVRKAHREALHRFEIREEGGHFARNPGQCWSITFDGRGFEVQPGRGDWSWGLEMESALAVSGVVKDGRLTYARGGGIEEWFVNDSRGLEQGWTLFQPSGPIRLRVRGGLEVVVEETRVKFGNRLTYGGLRAWDAEGRTVRTWFEPAEGGFAVHHDPTGAVYPVTIDPVAQGTYFKASDRDEGDRFGYSVAVDGDRMVVGALYEDSAATGVNGDQANNDALESGAAYIFVRDSGGTWTQEAYLKAFINSCKIKGTNV